MEINNCTFYDRLKDISKNRIFDYLPGISTITNLFHIFQKAVIMPSLKKDDIDNSHYYTHLKNKSFYHLFFLLIPGLGNFVILIIDIVKFASYKKKKASILKMLQADKERGWEALRNMCEKLRNDKEFILAVVKIDGQKIWAASKNLKHDPEIAIAALQNHCCPDQINEDLWKSKQFALQAVSIYGELLWHVDDDLKDDEEVVRMAYNNQKFVLQWATERVQNLIKSKN